MLYVGETSIHTKQRGQIRQCAWWTVSMPNGGGSRQIRIRNVMRRGTFSKGGIVEITRGSQERPYCDH